MIVIIEAFKKEKSDNLKGSDGIYTIFYFGHNIL